MPGRQERFYSLNEITKVGDHFRRATAKIDGWDVSLCEPDNDVIDCLARHNFLALRAGVHVAMHTGEVAKLAHVHLKNFWPPAAQRNRMLRKLLSETIHLESTATAAVAASAVCFRGRVVIMPLGFFWMPQRSARAIERLRFLERNIANWIDELEEFSIRRFLIKVVCLIADGVTLAALHPMIVIIEDFLERPAINYGLIALETFALFSFECLDRDWAKLDSLNGAPGIGIAVQNLDSVKARILERGEKTFFRERARDAPAPKLGVVLHFLGHFFIAHNVRDHCAPAFFQHPKNFIEQLPLRFRFDQIEDAIGNNDVDGVTGDERMFNAQVFGEIIGRKKRSRVRDRVLLQLSIHQFEIERQVLNAAFVKFHVGVTDALGHDERITPRDFQHFICHIDADHFSFRSDNLSGDETDFARAAAEVENRLAFVHMTGGIATTIIALDHFSWNYFEIFRVVLYCTTEFVCAFFCSRRITLAYDGLFAPSFNHSNWKV